MRMKVLKKLPYMILQNKLIKNKEKIIEEDEKSNLNQPKSIEERKA